MRSTSVDQRNETKRFLEKSGLNFLLRDTGSTVFCNDRPLLASPLTERFQAKLRNRSLLCAFKDFSSALQAIETFLSTDEYMMLTPSGMRFVHASSSTQAAYFRGGSYSSTFAYLREGQWRFVKQCQRYGHVDKDERLIAEIESIATLPKEAQKLFPELLDTNKNKQHVRYELEYVPYPDFAEVVRSSRHNAPQLTRLLTDVLDKLFDVLYVPIPDHKPQPSNYAEIIQTRLAETRNALPSDDFLHILLDAEQLRINGNEYDGLARSLQKADEFLRPKPLPATYNHGDLILQDILIDPADGDFRLVDPNGQSIGYMNDLAKLLLCLETKYDLFYDGDFKFEMDASKATMPAVQYEFTDIKHFKLLEDMKDGYMQYLEQHEQQYFVGVPDWRNVLMTLCGLQNIAIVMFHVLHHRKPERAAGFLVSGIKLINDTLAKYS